MFRTSCSRQSAFISIRHLNANRLQLRVGHKLQTPEAVTAAMLKGGTLKLKRRLAGAGEMTTSKTILIAGGAGYIGSHTVVELLDAGHKVVVVDDLSNSQANPDDDKDPPPSLLRAKQITGRDCLYFYKADICNKDRMNWIFDTHLIDIVFDFSGKKSVGESTISPILYYKENSRATMNLLKCMRNHGVRNVLFSSSCTVYGEPCIENLPVKETDPVGNCHCPYAKSKYFIECLLQDLASGEPDFWRIIILRYFNPVGAHSSGMIGEDPRGNPRNLLPKLAQTAIGKYQVVEVYAEDYETSDGSAVRDYVHVADVAKAHNKVVSKFEKMSKPIEVFNIGSGRGTSTWEMIRTFEKVSRRNISLKICPRREGDVSVIFCDPTKAERELDWKSEKKNEEMCSDLWKFYVLNPNGYQDASAISNSDGNLEY